MYDNTLLHVLSLKDDRNGISLKFQQKCKQDIKMQIADTTIDKFHNISLKCVRMCVCGVALIEHKETGMGAR